MERRCLCEVVLVILQQFTGIAVQKGLLLAISVVHLKNKIKSIPVNQY